MCGVGFQFIKFGIFLNTFNEQFKILVLLFLYFDLLPEILGLRFQKCCMSASRPMHGGDTLRLFTNSEENRKFYQKNGFVEFNEQWFTYRGKRLGSWSYQSVLS